ncbi:MAG: transcriptional regulator, partial [Rhodobacteraceae bacterium]|nr:transcriptional regulator [Paracoccaceae bacterium]
MASLWEYANPVKFMRLSGWLMPVSAGLAAALIVIGLGWGFFGTPDDFRQGSTVKIIFLHVPSALMAINAWAMMLVASLIWLVRRHHVSALAAKAAAPIGATMTLIALIT